jgi:hypothetical protein
VTTSSLPRDVVLITIDGLRYDDLGLTSGRLYHTPAIDGLAHTGLWCRRAYANSWYTQFSFPSLMTSTLPLDCGGYDLGITNRPLALAEALRAHGLRTAAFSTDPYLHAFYGYDRGFTEFFELFDADALWRHVCRDYLAQYLQWHRDGRIDRDSLHAIVHPLLRRLVRYFVGYYERKLSPPEQLLHRSRSPIYGRDVASQLHRARTGLAAIERDPHAFVERVLHLPMVVELDMATPLEAVAPEATPALPVVGAHDVVSCAAEWVRRQAGAPVFAWLSLNDVHDGGAADRQRAVTRVDHAIARLLDALHGMGRLDSTLIVVCADHGMQDGASPFSGAFSDAIIRVPLVVWSRHMRPRIDTHPCALLDVAPTVLDRLGLPARPEFRGVPIGSVAARARPHVIVEQLGGGPCDLERRTPLVCLVGKTYKYALGPDGRGWFNDLVRSPRVGFVPADDAVGGAAARLRADARRRLADLGLLSAP